MSKNHRPIAPIRPALTHLRQTDTDPRWQQWLSANKIVLVAAAGVIAIASIALGLASRYQTALPEGVIGQQGPYDHSRHPMYLTIVLFFLPGCAVLSDSWWFWYRSF